LSPEWRASVRQIDVATIRGQGGEIALYEVLWQTEDVTSMLPAIALTKRDQRRAARLKLTVLDREYVLDERHPQVVIGRADESDVVIRGNLISRQHARIEFNRNRFTLTDQSTNGTFVVGAGQEEAFVRRDSVLLKGEGLIGLGRVPEPDGAQTIRYVCEETAP
jgi:hypothetical protein